MKGKVKNIVIGSVISVLAAGAVIGGVTYSLLHNDVEVTNHLVTTDLNIKLTRSKLKYTTFRSGNLETVEVVTDGTSKPEIDFSKDKVHSIFADISAYEKSIQGFAPGLYREATLKVYAGNEIPFNYYVGFDFTYDILSNTELAKQIKVSFTNAKTSQSFLLSDMKKEVKDGDNYLGTVLGNSSDTFTVKVEFLDDCDPQSGLQPGDNDKVKGKDVYFDMTVYAVQYLK